MRTGISHLDYFNSIHLVSRHPVRICLPALITLLLPYLTPRPLLQHNLAVGYGCTPVVWSRRRETHSQEFKPGYLAVGRIGRRNRSLARCGKNDNLKELKDWVSRVVAIPSSPMQQCSRGRCRSIKTSSREAPNLS